MPCLVGPLTLVFPRLAIILVVIFSDCTGNAYQTFLWPLGDRALLVGRPLRVHR